MCTHNLFSILSCSCIALTRKSNLIGHWEGFQQKPANLGPENFIGKTRDIRMYENEKFYSKFLYSDDQISVLLEELKKWLVDCDIYSTKYRPYQYK